LAQDEERNLEYQDDLDDNVDVVVDDADEDGSGSPAKPWNSNNNRGYRDEFTDNDSDVFNDGDGAENDVYGLHSHVQD